MISLPCSTRAPGSRESHLNTQSSPSNGIATAGSTTRKRGGIRRALPDLRLAKASFSDGTLRYLDRPSGKGFVATGCNLDASDLQLSDRDRSGIMKKLSLSAEIDCGAVQTNDHAVSDLKMTVSGTRGVFNIKPLTTPWLKTRAPSRRSSGPWSSCSNRWGVYSRVVRVRCSTRAQLRRRNQRE